MIATLYLIHPSFSTLQIRSSNRNLLLEEDLHTASYERAVFEYRYIPGRGQLSCKHIAVKKDSSNFLSDFFDVLVSDQP